MSTDEIYDCVIVGGGPAAHNAALHLKGLNVIMLIGGYGMEIGPGGQLTTTTNVDNYPGFPKGIQGPELMDKMLKQTKNAGITVKRQTATKVTKEENVFIVSTKDEIFKTKTIIAATGASAKKLTVPGSEKYWTRGISACAVCDGFFFKDKVAAVIGGGDVALEEILYLKNICKKVILIHRRDVFRARADKVSEARNSDNIEFMIPYHLVECKGDDVLQSILLKNNETGENKEIKLDGLFFAIGHKPNTEFLKDLKGVEFRENGYLKTDDEVLTDVKGLFACGDLQDFMYRQAVTAGATGVLAATEVKKYLNK